MSGITSEGGIELRRDNTVSWSLGAGYLLTDELTLSAAAGFEIRDSNMAGFDYKNNYLMVQMKFQYDLGSNRF